jgi:bifunctional DNA-binding transcriptional regulator/antitoxin component of YhaV-PrlF toxin-antitoxin module
MKPRVKEPRRRGYTRVSAKHQVTLPIDALHGAGIQSGDRMRAEVRGPGEVLLIREVDPVEQFGGLLTDVYPAGGLDELRREWD